MRRGLLLAVAALAVVAATPSPAAHARERWDTQVLALVPRPGFPANAYPAPDGRERERFPATPLTGENGSAVPFDNPSSARFLGTRLMVANQSFLAADPTHQAILDVETGEPGLPEHIPAAAGPPSG